MIGLYCLDDCVLSHENLVPKFSDSQVQGGVFTTVLNSKANRTNRIESSTDLANWSTNAYLFSRSGTLRYTNSLTPSYRFFRARLLPGQ